MARRAAAVEVIPRLFQPGKVPLVSVEGTAYECGRHYAEIATEKYPGYRRYLDQAYAWRRLGRRVERLFERRAPYIPEVFRGLWEVAGPPAGMAKGPGRGGCTSFGVSGSITLDGNPISGQTKDTPPPSAVQYIVLRMRIKEGPTILVLAYPGEVLGYGLWTTGMSIFRNALFSTAGAKKGLTMVQWGILALAGKSVDEAVEMAGEFGITDAGNCLISDAGGKSCSVEFNVGGVGILTAKDGIATHANHPEAEETVPFENYPDKEEREDSGYRMHGLWRLLNAERGRLTAQKAMMLLADHTRYPRGICRHQPGAEERYNLVTSAAVVAEPTLGRLHVVRGNPCCNWATTHTA